MELNDSAFMYLLVPGDLVGIPCDFTSLKPVNSTVYTIAKYKTSVTNMCNEKVSFLVYNFSKKFNA